MTILTNLFSDISERLPEEHLQTLLETESLRIDRIISMGHCSPEGFWYDQHRPEWVLVVKGAARLRIEGQEPIDLLPGSLINIPAHQRHCVEWTDPIQPTIWLAIHYEAKPVRHT